MAQYSPGLGVPSELHALRVRRAICLGGVLQGAGLCGEQVVSARNLGCN